MVVKGARAERHGRVQRVRGDDEPLVRADDPRLHGVALRTVTDIDAVVVGKRERQRLSADDERAGEDIQIEPAARALSQQEKQASLHELTRPHDISVSITRRPTGRCGGWACAVG